MGEMWSNAGCGVRFPNVWRKRRINQEITRRGEKASVHGYAKVDVRDICGQIKCFLQLAVKGSSRPMDCYGVATFDKRAKSPRRK